MLIFGQSSMELAKTSIFRSKIVFPWLCRSLHNTHGSLTLARLVLCALCIVQNTLRIVCMV